MAKPDTLTARGDGSIAMYPLLLVAAGIFLGRHAFRSLGAARTAAILNRLFWVSYSGWAALVLYGMVWAPLHSYGVTTVVSPGDWQDVTAPFTPPPLSSYKGDAPQDQSSGVMGRARTNEFGDIAVTDRPPAKQQSSDTTAGPWEDYAAPASSPPHPPVDWKLASSMLTVPLLWWVAVIFIATGRPVWRARRS
jgi:hypothetical protein